MRTAAPALALGLLSLPVPAPAAPLAPTGKWVVNFDDAQCVASRAYGEDQLFLKAAPIGDVVQFGIMQSGRSGPPVQVEAEVLPSAGDAYRGTAVRWSANAPPARRMYLINMPVTDFERLSRAPSLALKIGDLRRDFAMPAMHELARVMKTCVDDLQQVWSSGGSGTPARAMANLASYFSDGDYPQDAIRNDQSGTTQFALLIDEQGKVADCMVIQSSGQAGLDTQSCAIVKKRARFTPARDANGKPTKDRVTSRISWRIP